MAKTKNEMARELIDKYGKNARISNINVDFEDDGQSGLVCSFFTPNTSRFSLYMTIIYHGTAPEYGDQEILYFINISPEEYEEYSKLPDKPPSDSEKTNGGQQRIY